MCDAHIAIYFYLINQNGLAKITNFRLFCDCSEDNGKAEKYSCIYKIRKTVVGSIKLVFIEIFTFDLISTGCFRLEVSPRKAYTDFESLASV